jgi:hypothetical protein
MQNLLTQNAIIPMVATAKVIAEIAAEYTAFPYMKGYKLFLGRGLKGLGVFGV